MLDLPRDSSDRIGKRLGEDPWVNASAHCAVLGPSGH
jgi:hypothetical protein